MSRKLASLFVAIAIAAAVIAPASAAPAAPTVTLAVSYGDLDLTQAAGAKTLKRRLKTAVQRVCGNANTYATPVLRHAIRSCQAELTDKAVASINAPQLTALYARNERSQLAAR